jgi:xanthine/uracil permease
VAKKPANLIYGLDESPSLGTTLLLGLQHILALSSVFVYTVILVQAAGMLAAQAERMIHTLMIVIGIATTLQALRYGRIGSRLSLSGAGRLCISPGFYSDGQDGRPAALGGNEAGQRSLQRRTRQKPRKKGA